MTTRLLLLQVDAVAISVFGFLLITRDGAFGSGRQIDVGQGVALLSIGIVYGWWLSPMVAAISGIRGAFLALVVLDVLWVVVAQGVAGLVFCAFPVCPDFAPWGDVVRYGSLVIGGAAAWSAWRAYRAIAGPTQWAPAVTALVLVIVSFAVQAVNTKIP